MGIDDGFFRWSRRLALHRPVASRILDFREVVQRHEPDTVREQAGRCMDCGVPFCHQGCPLGNEIPDFDDLVYRGEWREAWVRLSSTNPFPEFTGRICPAPCEAACTLSINDDPVTIEQIELEIAERAFDEGWVTPNPPSTRTGKRVAVVGSGPAGLAAASQLNAAGHTVTVFDAAEEPGGLLRYGIPDFKLEKSVLDRRLALLRAEGIRFRMGVEVGVEPSWSGLAATHDAVLIAIGAGTPRDLSVPGRALQGVHVAMTYLTAANRAVAGHALPEALDAKGKRVVILGGGDTGSDCLGTAIRQGAVSVQQIELMPRPPATRAPSTPWPHWPLVYRTSTSQEEGGTRVFSVLTKRFVGVGGAICGLQATPVRRARDGRFVPTGQADMTIEADLVLLALGFQGPATERLTQQLGVELDEQGLIETDGFQTNVPGVFAAGDARRGQSLIVWAIQEGREAARAIDATLEGEVRLPTRGVDHAFA